jgi:hypothetical protein
MHPSIGCTQKADLAEILQKKGPCKSKVMRIKPEKNIIRLEASDKETHLSIFLLNLEHPLHMIQWLLKHAD